MRARVRLTVKTRARPRDWNCTPRLWWWGCLKDSRTRQLNQGGHGRVRVGVRVEFIVNGKVRGWSWQGGSPTRSIGVWHLGRGRSPRPSQQPPDQGRVRVKVLRSLGVPMNWSASSLRDGQVCRTCFSGARVRGRLGPLSEGCSTIRLEYGSKEALP